MEDGSPIIDSLYEQDFTAWAEQQVEALRRRDIGGNALDYENIAEEIEDVAKHVERTCKSYLGTIIEHLLKLQFGEVRYDERGWRSSVMVARDELDSELTPTLRKRMPILLKPLFERELTLLAAKGTMDIRRVRSALPDGYSWEQLTDSEWWPERSSDQRRVMGQVGLEPRGKRLRS